MGEAPEITPRWWLPLVLALVPTGGVAWTTIEELKGHPFPLLGLALSWMVMAGIIRILQALWERWRPGLLDWCDARIRSWFHGTKGKYLGWVQTRNRDFDVKGLSTQGNYSLDLSSVFVDLRLAPVPVHRANANPVPIPTPREGDAPAEVPFTDAIARHPLLAMLGAPGCGKTTLLRRTALLLSGLPSERNESGLPEAVPILVYLRDVVALLTATEPAGLVDAIAAGTRGHAVDKGWLTRELANRRCLVMLDGLDEVADPAARLSVVRWVEDQVAAFPGNRWVVTARPFGYQSNPIAGFSVLSVQPLRRFQIEDFLLGWYRENERMAAQRLDAGVEAKATEGAADLLLRIDSSPDLVRLAVNPLLLTLIANVHRWRSSLPGRRVELYAEICEVFLGKRQEARGLTSVLTPAQRKLVLQSLAWHLMQTRRREIPEEEAADVVRDALERVSPGEAAGSFFRSVESSSGLLLEREAGVWGFAHKTFQEFLAAVHAHEQRLVNSLVQEVADDWWHETIRLYCALGDATGVVRACVSGDPPGVASLVLAIQCVDEAREVDPAVRKSLFDLVDSQLDSDDPERRRLAAECRLELRLRGMERIDDAVFVSPDLVSCAEYQLFVLAEAEAGRARQPDHWQGRTFPVGTARSPAVGVRGVDAIAFCAWLTARDGGDWTYRLPSFLEFEQVTDGGVPSGAGYWFRDHNDALTVFSRDVHDDMTMVMSRFEQVIGEDLRRVAELSPAERERLGLVVSSADVEVLIALSKWADAGGIRAGRRLLTTAIEVWPTTRWWKGGRAVIKAVLFGARLGMRAVGVCVRAWVRTLALVRGGDPTALRRRAQDVVGTGVERLIRGIGDVVVWSIDPLAWLLGPVLRRVFRKELETLALPAASGASAPEAWSPSALARLFDQTEDQEAKMRALASLTLLLLTQFVGGLFLQGEFQVPARGTAILALSQRMDIPPSLARLAKALAERDREGSWEKSASAETSWATRISLLLWWRHGMAETFAEFARRKGRTVPGQPEPKEIEIAPLDAWLDAWAIGERAAGTTIPFEGIRIVKERHHGN